MGPKSYPLRVLGQCLRLTLLLAAGPVSGAAQATGGFTTAFSMATEAAVRAVTTRVYPVAAYAGYRSIEALLLAAQTPRWEHTRQPVLPHRSAPSPQSHGGLFDRSGRAARA